MNYERHLTYFQFLIYRKIIESNLEGLILHVLLNWHKNQGKFGWMKTVMYREHGKEIICSLSRFWTLMH